MNASVALCTLEPIDRTAPGGFAARWACVAGALADTFDTTIVNIASDGSAPLVHEEPLRTRIAGEQSVVLPDSLSQRLRGRLGPIGRGASIGVDAVTGRPPWLVGDTRAGAGEELRRTLNGFDLVVLPYHLAHLVEVVGRDLPVVAFLDEGPERRIFSFEGTPRASSAAHAGLRRHAAEALYRRAGDRASIVIVISELERFLFGSFVPPDRIHVIPVTTDPTLTELDPTPAPVDERRRILISGRFDVQRKTYARLGRQVQDADAGLRGAGIRPTWVLAGLGADAVDTGPLDCIRWKGADLREVYRPADLAIVPGQTIIGVRSTLLQAFATATPAVALWDAMWTIGATPHVDAFTAAGSAGLAAAIVDAATSDRLAEVGLNGRRFHATHTSWQIVGDAAIDACREPALARGAPG